MRRRTFLAASAAGLALPAIARAQGATTLRFVPQANLANLDPIWTTLYVVRNASVLFWDTLYGVYSQLRPQPQMCEGHEVSPDGLTWTFKLRPNLRWHDNEPVRAADCTASLQRWMVRDTTGQIIRAKLNEMAAIDGRTFRFSLKQPFGKLLYAIGKAGSPCAFMMPERMAKTDPFKQIGEYIGSGPFRFKRDEWVPGPQAVFERFAGYVPRDEPADWFAGSKRVFFDRVEWKIIPDAAAAGAALQNGEVHWWESPIPDLVPQLRGACGVALDIADPLGNIGDCRFNHLYPPFDDVRVRRAVLTAARIDAWFDAADQAAETGAARDFNKAQVDFATFLPTGFFKGYQAWRKNLSGIVRAPFPVVWGVKKA